jgi:hypothetical protein
MCDISKGGTQAEGVANRVQRNVFGPRRDEVRGEWKKFHNEELNDLYYSTNIVRVIKLRKIRWAEYVTRMVERRVVYRFWWET